MAGIQCFLFKHPLAGLSDCSARCTFASSYFFNGTPGAAPGA